MKYNLDKLVEMCETSANPGDVFELPGLRIEVIVKNTERIEICLTNGNNQPKLWWQPTIKSDVVE